MVNVLKAMGIQQWQCRPERAEVDGSAVVEGAVVDVTNSEVDQQAFSQAVTVESYQVEPQAVELTPFDDQATNEAATSSFSGSLKQAVKDAKEGQAKSRDSKNASAGQSSTESIDSHELVNSLEPISSLERVNSPEPIERPEPIKSPDQETANHSVDDTSNTKTDNQAVASQKENSSDESVKKRVMPINLSALLGSEAATELEAKQDVGVIAQASFEQDVPPIEDSMVPPIEDIEPEYPVELMPESTNSNKPSWENLESRIKTNEHCPSCGWGNAFLGSGNQKADLMFILDAPTSREVEQGLLLAGRAGQLFDAMLSAIGLDREHVYCASVFKCAPTNDLSITPQCDAMLRQQIELVTPRYIVTFGEFVAQTVIKSNLSLKQLRESQQQHSELNVPIIPTYSPVEMLDNSELKALVWQDLKKLLALKRT